ncbi:MAG: radical SAM protein [Treponema sp.]|nr:radical SAM protein [Treponema sp.]
MKDIFLTTINAKWIHPSLGLRLLKANLGALEDRCEILEFALRQPLAEKLEPFASASPRILAVSVSIWNHLATLELLGELEKMRAGQRQGHRPVHRPVIVLGGPEVSHLPPEAEIFRYADYVIRGEGETAFRVLCEKILADGYEHSGTPPSAAQFINAENVDVSVIKSAYHLYTDEDITKKLIYVEASRGCPFNCEFCLSAVKDRADSGVREFPLEPFLSEMDELVRRGVKTFKFLDRTFNINIKRACRIMEFFLEKIERKKGKDIVVHFEMVPSLFPPALRQTLSRFPPGTLRLEIGIQTLNPQAAARICRAGWQRQFNCQQSNCQEKELDAIRFLREKTNAIIHVDLIAGLPGEDLVSFGMGFDRLISCLAMPNTDNGKAPLPETDNIEIQIGILKLLPGAPISRHNDAFGMCYNSLPPYEIKETSAMSAADLLRIKNFARFWEIIVNRRLLGFDANKFTFKKFLALSDFLYAHFGKNWGIDKNELLKTVKSFFNL